MNYIFEILKEFVLIQRNDRAVWCVVTSEYRRPYKENVSQIYMKEYSKRGKEYPIEVSESIPIPNLHEDRTSSSHTDL